MSVSADLDELRRTYRRSTFMRWALASGSVLVVLSLGAVVWFSPLLAVQSVTAEGGDIVDVEAVRADVEARTMGVPLLQVRAKQIGQELETEHTAAASIDVSYVGPRSLQVTVVDRAPVIAVVDGADAVRYDAEGVSIDTVSADGLELPVLSVAHDADPAAAARGGAALLTQIGGILPGDVDVLSADADGTFTLRVVTATGPADIVFGTAEDAERKAQVAAVLLDDGHDRIDVSVVDVPTAG